MPTVWLRADRWHRNRFHRTPQCHELRKASARGGPGNPVVAVDLEAVGVRPCRHCYPDAPHLSISKRYCPLCDSRHACAHNGGLEVIDRQTRHYWVWPDANQMPYYRRQSI